MPLGNLQIHVCSNLSSCSKFSIVPNYSQGGGCLWGIEDSCFAKKPTYHRHVFSLFQERRGNSRFIVFSSDSTSDIVLMIILIPKGTGACGEFQALVFAIGHFQI